MKNIWKRVISVMLGLMMSAPGISARASAADNTDKVQVWRRTDIVLQSEKEYNSLWMHPTPTWRNNGRHMPPACSSTRKEEG